MTYDLYDKRQYLAELTRRFQKAGSDDHILLMSMWIEPDIPEITAMLDALERAAQAGAQIHLSIDARCFLDNGGRSDPSPLKFNKFGPLWFHKKMPAKLHYPYACRYSAIERFASYPNVSAKIINKPERRFSIAFAGRSHIKTAIINNYAFVGGCNLDEVENIDMMIGWQDKQSVHKLYQILSEGIDDGTIHRGFKGKDQTIIIDENSKVLIDAGIRGQSVIFDSALNLIDHAQKWLVTTSQFFPNGITAQHLNAARKKDINLQIFSSHWQKLGTIGSIIELTSRTIERMRMPAEMFNGELPPDLPYLHAKLIASDQGVMIGSHNYVKAGTTFGTAEIALISDDEKLAKRAKQSIENQIKEAGSRQSQN